MCSYSLHLHRHATLNTSMLVIDATEQGAATGRMSYLGASDGVLHGQASLFAQATDNNLDSVFFTESALAWESPSGAWTEDGSASIQSLTDVRQAGIGWNTTANLVYGDNAYIFYVFESDYTQLYREFVATGSGAYGGSWTDWFATLDHSSIVIDEKDFGAASGGMQYEVPSSATDGRLALVMNATYNENSAVFFTDDLLQWSTGSDWVSAGNIRLLTQLYSTSLYAWNASADVSYGDNAYSLFLRDNAYGVVVSADPLDSRFLASGHGGYGGVADNW